MPERDGQAQWLRLLREASTPEACPEPAEGSPVREIRSPGSVRGQSGNWLSYRDSGRSSWPMDGFMWYDSK